MPHPRFSIGIDLGTTNSALAYAPLDGEGTSEVLPIPQWEQAGSIAEAPTLPSFLYLPEPAVAGQVPGRGAGSGQWIVGRLARRKAAETPGRVAHSVKSWLCHHAADRSARFLPWGSEDIDDAQKISPIHASALILNALRNAWNDRFAASGPDFAFDAQEIIVTVPASFDAVAQGLTLTAARDAGFPETVRLLEEPQAAFYRWLESCDFTADLRRKVASPDARTLTVLVVDVGGGTSDFSLFEVDAGDDGEAAIRRTAVSDHILLGGDNIDLALARRIEPKLTGEAGELSGVQWEHLVATCRDLKETALAGEGPDDEAFPVALAGRGSGLIAGSQVARIGRSEIEAVVLDGFFPECEADDAPRRTRVALKEWGLPFATDSAITRHLAGFLKDRPRVDAVLFNGGALYPQPLRQRLRQQIGKWQAGEPPLLLANPEPHLAVARGAARYGKLRCGKAGRIEAGAGHAIFLAAHRTPAAAADWESSGPALVCVLPLGAAPEETFEIGEVGLELLINRPARFETFTSTRDRTSRAGDIVEWRAETFQPLPPLETVARLDGDAADQAGRTVPVTLSAKLNDVGLLRVACRSAEPGLAQVWPLDFNLRPNRRGPLAGSALLQAEPNASGKALDAARERIATVFAQPLNARVPLTSARLLKSLESALGVPKSEWNWVLLRSLWPALERASAHLATSVEHEETWLILAGFLLRPGFGAPMDDLRIDELWRLRAGGLRFPGKRNALQAHVLWRRVAGGLSRQRQEEILAPDLDRILQRRNPPAELVRLAGALERIGRETKVRLVESFIATATQLARERKHCAPYLAALGLLLNRAPLYAGPDSVVAPDLVERAFQAFSGCDWSEPELSELQSLFLRAARVTDNRTLDLPKGLRKRIAAKLEKAGVPPLRTASLKEFNPLQRADRAGLYGEALPPGLILTEDGG